MSIGESQIFIGISMETIQFSLEAYGVRMFIVEIYNIFIGDPQIVIGDTYIFIRDCHIFIVDPQTYIAVT